MYSVRNLIIGYASALILTSNLINAQQPARSVNVTSSDNAPQQFSGNRNSPNPETNSNPQAQQAKKSRSKQPAVIQQASIPQDQNRFNGSREAGRPSAGQASVAIKQEPQGPVKQFTGSRDASTPSRVNTVQTVPQPVTTVNRNPNAAQPSTAFGGNRTAPQQARPVVVEQKAAVHAAPVNMGQLSNLHAFSNNRQLTVNTQLPRARPIVVHATLPQAIRINQRSAICPYITLSPFAIAKKGNYLELNDGSVWKVRHRDRNKVKRWSPSDAIVIETGGFFSWYAYSLVNYTRNESIDVELHLSDSYLGSTSHWIVEVNPFQGYVKLENGSIWRLSTSELANWSQNDDVIIGLSKDWFSSQYNYVLINPKAKSRFTATFEF